MPYPSFGFDLRYQHAGSSLWKSIPRQGMIGVEVEVRWNCWGFQLFTAYICTSLHYTIYNPSSCNMIHNFHTHNQILCSRTHYLRKLKSLLGLVKYCHLSSFTGKLTAAKSPLTWTLAPGTRVWSWRRRITEATWGGPGKARGPGTLRFTQASPSFTQPSLKCSMQLL